MGRPTNNCFGNVDVHAAVGFLDGEVGRRGSVNVVVELAESSDLADLGLGANSDAWLEKDLLPERLERGVD